MSDIPKPVAERRPTADAGHVLAAALKDAGIAALIALGLFSLIVGLQTETGPTGALELIPRPALLATIVGLVFVGRLAVVLLAHSGAFGFATRLFAASGAKEGLGALVKWLVGPGMLVFALIALVLSAAGLYASLAYQVVLRTREIGIRSALGAERRSIVAMVVGHGARLALAGVAVGLLVAAGSARAVQSLLYETSAFDAVSYAAAAILVLLTAVLAAWVPARRAAGVSPMTALRDQ